MLKRLIALILLGAVILSVTGCIRTVDDRRRMAVPFTRDKIEGRYQFPVDRVFQVAKEVLAANGQLTAENTINKSIEGVVDTRHVWVRVESVSEDWTKATVQVRTRGGGSDIRLASEVDKQIALRLATGKPTLPFIPAVDAPPSRGTSTPRPAQPAAR